MSSHPFSSSRNVVPQEHTLQLDFDLELESGAVLPQPVLAFQTWGTLNSDRSNVVWVCHALTGNHRVHEWWGGLFGDGKLFDPKEHFIVCVNVPGSCYGSTGPLSFRTETERWFRSFPQVTVRDMVKALDLVRIFMEIDRISVLIGASLGGQQALEWAVQQPQLFERIVPIATNVQHSPFGIAFNEAQRLAIQADPSFFRDEYCGGRNGLIAARSIAMLSYRSYEGYALTQSEQTDKRDGFKAASYQQYQGEKLANRFNAYSYWYLSKAMDAHNLSRNRVPAEELLAAIDIPALVVGITSDLLFPLCEQEFIAEQLPNAQLVTLTSAFGHDGFLVEYEQLENALRSFLGKDADGLQSVSPTNQLTTHNS
jgi:homoserine O-acetyltransferase/O-succinyltransferase